jgi:hypothetical protein
MAAVAETLFSSGGGAAAALAPAAPAAQAPAGQAPVPAAAAPPAAALAVPPAMSAAPASLPPPPAPRASGGGLLAPPQIDPPQGLYVMAPAGIDAADRRRTALAAAACLAPRGGTAAVLLLERGAAEVHVLGDAAGGRPQAGHCLDPADAGRAIRELLVRCDQVAVVPLESLRGVPRGLAGRAGRTVFVAAADAESVVETYRELKAWRARGLAMSASLLVVGTDGAAEAGRLVGRLRRASREFLGCDLASQGFLGPDAAALAAGRPETPRPLARAPVADIWPQLLGPGREARAADDAAGRAGDAPAKTRDSHLFFGGDVRQKAYPRVSEAALPAAAVAAEKIGDCPSFLDRQGADATAAGAPAAHPYAVFSLWRGHGREELAAAIVAQPPAILDPSLRQVIRVDVDEADAPPLAAVRDDGALVAILIAPAGQPGRPADPQAADPQAAARWLKVHRRLLALAYPCAGIQESAEPSAIVFAPPDAPPADGLRRYLPIQLGGHRGVVLLP